MLFPKIIPLIVFHVVLILFRYIQMNFGGMVLTIISYSEKFWPLSGRNIARKIVHQCVRCCRVNPKMLHPLMSNLPMDRIVLSPPFYITGADYAGPYLLKDRKGRGCKITKAYLFLFICFTTKAIHLELVSDLSTQIFMAAFRRFIARRGKPSKVYSDNGSNFRDANNKLANLATFL